MTLRSGHGIGWGRRSIEHRVHQPGLAGFFAILSGSRPGLQ